MQKREVSKQEIDEKYLEFCKDLGAIGETKEEIGQYLKECNMVVIKAEDKDLIWFEQIENNEVKYYSSPIEKFVAEPEKEMMFYVSAGEPFGLIRIPESAMPIRQFAEKRKGKITPAEENRKERESRKSSYQRNINWAFEGSVLGYIVFDGKAITYPRNKDNSITLEYKGWAKRTVDYYNDADLLKELLSDKDRYSWYNLNDNEYFIVRNSNKREYQFLADEKTQEIKLAKIVGNKIVLEDIIKDEFTLKVEKEIDEYLTQSDMVVNSRYIRYRNNCFEVVKTNKVHIPVKEERFELFPKMDYRVEGRYQIFTTDLSLSDVEKVVKEGDKYKWFEYGGVLYITDKVGGSRFNIIVDDYIDDCFNTPECVFNYRNSPKPMVKEFVKNGIWDGDKIIEKYNCSQESIDNITRQLIRHHYIERNSDGSNKYKIIKYENVLPALIFDIEYELHL